MNIGRDGITTNASIPGTGLSYREKVGKGGKTGWFGILALVAGMGFWAFQHVGKIEKAVASRPSAATSSTDLSTKASTDALQASPAPVNTTGNMPRYIHRGNSILRAEPKASGGILKREMKGATVTLISEEAGGWAKVTDGNVTGYMRSSILGAERPN